jgi:hypothetical protein
MDMSLVQMKEHLAKLLDKMLELLLVRLLETMLDLQ